MKNKLEVNKKYLLRYNHQFSHCIGKKGFNGFSKNLMEYDRIEATFVGTVNSGANGAERNIFVTEDRKRLYISFGTDNLDYIVEEVDVWEGLLRENRKFLEGKSPEEIEEFMKRFDKYVIKEVEELRNK